MSHSSGSIKFKDGEIRHYEYNGTNDTVISHSYKTVEELRENWRKGNFLECLCGKEEPVSIYTSYANGWYMNGVACKECNSIRVTEFDEDGVPIEYNEDWANKNIFK